jgi:hypothetical protein
MYSLVPALGIVLQVVTAERPPELSDLNAKRPPRYLATVRVLGVQESRGEVTLLDSEGNARTLREGDRVAEEDAVLKDVTRSTLVLTRNVTGSDGAKGESLIVVRFDASGKVKVREYATVAQDPSPKPPPPLP